MAEPETSLVDTVEKKLRKRIAEIEAEAEEYRKIVADYDRLISECYDKLDAVISVKQQIRDWGLS